MNLKTKHTRPPLLMMKLFVKITHIYYKRPVNDSVRHTRMGQGAPSPACVLGDKRAGSRVRTRSTLLSTSRGLDWSFKFSRWNQESDILKAHST